MATKAKKDGLPEVSVDTGDIVVRAKAAREAQAKAAEYTTIEKTNSKIIGDLAETKRQEELAKNKYIGLIRVTGKDLAPIRIEFRLENGALALEEESKLDTLYGAVRPMLFEREKVVTAFLDPYAMIQELKDQGKNPFDYLEIKIKKDMDHIFFDSPSVLTTEAFLPKSGFLNTLNEINHTLSADAKTYTNNYLNETLSPRVVLGSR